MRLLSLRAAVSNCLTRLLLTYGQTRDRLSLLATGAGTFNDLCDAVPRTEDVFFGFCRERDGDTNYFALIAFVPEGVSGVKRGEYASLVIRKYNKSLMVLVATKQGPLFIRELSARSSRYISSCCVTTLFSYVFYSYAYIL